MILSKNSSLSDRNFGGISNKSNINSNSVWSRNEKGQDIRQQNILAAKAITNAIRTSLGPRGMDKMIQDAKGSVIVTNDGATILQEMSVSYPTAKMMVELSHAQDVEAGDGTTSVVIICGALLDACQTLVNRGLHPQIISSAFFKAERQAERILRNMAIPIDLNDHEALVKNAATSLYSKVVSQSAPLLAKISVDAVMKVIHSKNSDPYNFDINDIRFIKKLGGTVDDCELINGLVFSQQKISKKANGPRSMQNAKIGLIQFCLSAPKTDMENNIVVKDYQSIDRLLKDEKLILAKMVKQIAMTGCNVLLIQKSILRDSVNDFSLDYLAKSKILVIRDIERDDIEFISRTCGCEPVASIDQFTPDALGYADMVYEEDLGDNDRIVRITGVKANEKVSIIVRGSNTLVLDETERSLHDAICVVRSIVKTRAILPGGGAPEMELAQKLHQWSRTLDGEEALCAKAYAEAFEIIPFTLAENAGLNPIQIVTELRNKHANTHESKSEQYYTDLYSGIDVRKGAISNMHQENIVQPLLVTLSAVKLATEVAITILKIDDIVMTR